MRDAFGGVFMIRLFIVFLFIYVSFAALSLNYAKAFRVKNSIISFVEENEIIDLRSINNVDKLDTILQNANYNKECSKGNGPIQSVEGKNVGYCHNGIVILKQSEEKISGTKSSVIKYQVIAYADWNLGPLTKLLALGGQKTTKDDYVDGTWEITGEAKVILRG